MKGNNWKKYLEPGKTNKGRLPGKKLKSGERYEWSISWQMEALFRDGLYNIKSDFSYF